MLLGSYEGSWRWGALTALFPLLWFVFVLPGVLSSGRWAPLAGVAIAALVSWLVVGAWVFVRAGTRLEIFERSVVWTRPVFGRRVLASREIVRVQRVGLDATRAVRLTLTDRRECEIKGFAQLAEIASLLEGTQRAAAAGVAKGT